MQAQITYLLTEQAQRAQMVATGQPVARKQTMMIELAAGDLALFPIQSDGAVSLDLTGYNGPRQFTEPLNAAGWHPWNGGSGTESNSINPPVADDIRKGRSILADKARKAEEQIRANAQHNKEATEAAYQRFMADASLRINQSVLSATGVRAFVGTTVSPSDWFPENHAEFMTEIRRRDDADTATKKAEELAKEQAKHEYIARWISEHGDADISEQFTEGLLARSAALSLIADDFFRTLGIPDAVSPQELRHCQNGECPCCDMTVESLPRRIYPSWRDLKGMLPKGSRAQFSKVRECLRCDDEEGDWQDGGDSAGPIYYTADLTVPCGPFQFERRVKLG